METTAPDIYGQVHPIETPELIQIKLQELSNQLQQQIPDTKKVGYLQAVIKCPTIVNDTKFQLIFLRCEQFNAELAAIRYTKYWDKRIEIFGPERAFLPITLASYTDDDIAALKHGFVRWVHQVRDPSGRAVIYTDPSRTSPDRLCTVRAVWYVLHAALEDEGVQQKGVVLISDPRKAKLTQFDSKLDKMNIESIRGCIPVRVSAFHLCHMPPFFSIIFPIVKVFLGEKLRKRIKLHQGSVNHVLDRLQVYGLSRDKLPDQLGGTVPLDQEKWVTERQAAGL